VSFKQSDKLNKQFDRSDVATNKAQQSDDELGAQLQAK
jgi:hypothetical protein